MQAQPHDVDGRLQKFRINRSNQRVDRPVGRDHRPMPIDGERWVWFVGFQQQVDCRPRTIERRVAERALAKDRRIPSTLGKVLA